MNEFKYARQKYEEIPIPESYDAVIARAIEKGKRRSKTKGFRIAVRSAAGVAAACAALVVGLNTSPVFAQVMQSVPVLGEVCKVFTIRQYDWQSTDGNVNTTVNRPEFIANDTASTAVSVQVAERVNAEINRRVAEYQETAQRDIAEYKAAFLQTGGTEQEWAEHDIDVAINYDIKSQNPERLSFVMHYTQSWAAAFAQNDYYNISLKDGHALTLQELLGEDYAAKIERQVRAQAVQRRAENPKLEYWLGNAEMEQGLAKDVFQNPNFYLNEAGQVVVVFEKYTIAPGYMGACEFTISNE